MTLQTKLTGNGCRTAITLVELLVVFGIAGVLLALITVAIVQSRESAARLQCQNNLKQIGLAALSFQNAQKRLPPASGFMTGEDMYSVGSGHGTVFFHLLPYLDQANLYQASRYRPPHDPHQDFYFSEKGGVAQTPVAVFHCPSDPTWPADGIDPTGDYAASNYAANYVAFGRVDAEFTSVSSDGRAVIPASFPDGLAQTLLFTEKYAVSSIPTLNAGVAKIYKGGCLWAYFAHNCYGPFVAYYYDDGQGVHNDPQAVGPGAGGPAELGFQVQPSATACNPCLPSTPHNALNGCMADGSVRTFAPGMSRKVWWAYVTPAAGDRVQE